MTTGAIEQFKGATVEAIGITHRGGRDGHALSLGMRLRLKDGSTRDLEAYTLSVGHVIHFRVDGMYVPPEELPGNGPLDVGEDEDREGPSVEIPDELAQLLIASGQCVDLSAASEIWRVGQRVPEHVYIGDRPLVTMPTAELAALVVDAVNARKRNE